MIKIIMKVGSAQKYNNETLNFMLDNADFLY